MKNARKIERIKIGVVCASLICGTALFGGNNSAVAVSKESFIDTRNVYTGAYVAEFVETRDSTNVASSFFTETIDTATPIFTLLIVR